ncbi:MAG: response regulator transcription factor [Candidatus Ratteibacteria bacterium]|nr:response regulator transcription factor [Candidatus Ratteibacteria bacterium]
MNEKIAVLEDEKDILELIAFHLNKAGYRVYKFSKADDLFKSMEREKFDLLILDLILPDMDGIDICKQIKTSISPALPIIMVTAKAETEDKIIGLEMGADDYITKPFSPKELVARVKTVLRRYKTTFYGEEIIKIGNSLVIDTAKHSVYVDNKQAKLTFAEFGILKILASKKGWVFSRDKIIKLLWEGEKVVIERTVDVHIKNLREKLGKAGKYIKNVRGVGYKIEE